MKIAIIGYGGQGQAAVEYWSALDSANELTVCDKNKGLKLPKGIASRLGPDHLEGLDEFDLIVRTPSLHPTDIVSANPDAPNILDKVTTVTNEFMRVCPTKNIIGVTGTKGKGTTSTLITKILEAAGHRVHLGGNIGIPPLELLARRIKPNDWVVLELANFQLIDLKYAPHIGVCVMVAPEHLDWHTDMEEYVEAKTQMFREQTTDDLAVFNRLNDYSEQIASVSAGTKISYEVPEKSATPTKTAGAYVNDETIYMDDTEVCKVSDVALLGRHNLQNICAAIAATWDVISQNPDIVKHVVQNLKGLPNRLEKLRTTMTHLPQRLVQPAERSKQFINRKY
jgi:UDP-N-acetylmuramoylalanine--D-glutamate ligase